MIDLIECNSPEDFYPKLSECEEMREKPLFLLFTGSKNVQTGRSWCPDCVAADPIIIETLEKIDGGCVLLVCSVDRESYRTADYIYRTDPRIKLTCVPTLIKWSGGKVLARLNDSQSQMVEFVQDLVDA